MSAGGSGGSSPRLSTSGGSAERGPRNGAGSAGGTAAAAKPKPKPADSDTRPAAVTVDRVGPVTTVILNRPDVRNAVDATTAAALAEAFADFDADSDAAVAVLYGAGGTF